MGGSPRRERRLPESVGERLAFRICARISAGGGREAGVALAIRTHARAAARSTVIGLITHEPVSKLDFTASA